MDNNETIDNDQSFVGFGRCLFPTKNSIILGIDEPARWGIVRVRTDLSLHRAIGLLVIYSTGPHHNGDMGNIQRHASNGQAEGEGQRLF